MDKKDTDEMKHFFIEIYKKHLEQYKIMFNKRIKIVKEAKDADSMVEGLMNLENDEAKERAKASLKLFNSLKTSIEEK